METAYEELLSVALPLVPQCDVKPSEPTACQLPEYNADVRSRSYQSKIDTWLQCSQLPDRPPKQVCKTLFRVQHDKFLRTGFCTNILH